MNATWGSAMVLALATGCAGAASLPMRTDAGPTDAGTRDSAALPTIDGGTAPCPDGHRILATADGIDVVGGHAPRYPSTTRFDRIASTPVDSVARDGTGYAATVLVFDPGSGDTFAVSAENVIRFDRSGVVWWSASGYQDTFQAFDLQLDATTGRVLTVDRPTGPARLLDATTGVSAAGASDGTWSRSFMPDGQLVITPQPSNGDDPSALIVLDGVVERSRIPLVRPARILATTCDHVFVYIDAMPSGEVVGPPFVSPEPSQIAIARLSDASIVWQQPMGDLADTAVVPGVGLVVAAREPGPNGTAFSVIGLDGTVTRLAWIPAFTSQIVVDEAGNIFARLGDAMARVGIDGAVTVAPFPPFSMVWTHGDTMILTSDGELIVTTMTAAAEPHRWRQTLHFLSASTLEERRTFTFPFDVCGQPIVGADSTIYVADCDGAIQILGERAP